MMRRNLTTKVVTFAAGVLISFPALSQDKPAMDPALEAGRLLFEVTAGDVGCAACHGMHGEGGEGPKIAGQNVENIQAQLVVNDSMSFIELTEEQLQQIEDYLKYLHELEAH